MKKHLNAAVIITMILAVLSVAISIKFNENNRSFSPAVNRKPQSMSATKDESPKEMRGLWVSYISLDMSGTDRSEEAFREKLRNISATAKEYSCNSVFIHVRAFCDAFYDSEIFPSSHILWGKQGSEENFDGLKIMC